MEQVAAKTEYFGKLTLEILNDKRVPTTSLSELDLSHQKIRQVECLWIGFEHIRTLKFDNNLIASIDCFKGLLGLKILCLNHNKIANLITLCTPCEGKVDESPFLMHLEELYLSGNLITRIFDLYLFRFPGLKILDLKNNKISKVISHV